MNTNKATSRERKYNKNRYGMRVDGKSIFTIQEAIIKSANKSKNKRNSRHYVIKGS
jgi:hypothetical protein